MVLTKQGTFSSFYLFFGESNEKEAVLILLVPLNVLRLELIVLF